MRVIVASALGEARLAACLDALHTSAPDWQPEVHVVEERGTREATWNAGLDAVGRDQDVLFLGDDITLTPGFRDALERGAARAEIVGLCTVDPPADDGPAASRRVGDRGYRLARTDGRVTVEALDRGETVEGLEPFGVRACDAVCGCLFLVKAPILRAVERFRPEGMNRWGELIFALEARAAGARVAVVEHYVEHAATSSKAKTDPLLASTSWSTERQLWSRVVDRFVRDEWVSDAGATRIDPGLRRWLDRPGRLVFYGAGTVAAHLLEHAGLGPERVLLCSGLPEEAGVPFQGHEIVPVGAVRFTPTDRVLVTPLHRGEKIAREEILPRLPRNFRGQVGAVGSRTEPGGGRSLCLEELDTEPHWGAPQDPEPLEVR